MKFKLLTFQDEDVLGGAVALGNAYISAYGMLVRGKPPAKLAVGESCVKRYALSGQMPTEYKIVRVE
jgi:hypothetical protein